MPNWVRNNIIAREPETLKKLLLDENGDVDFNKVIPMPQDLHITSGSMSYKVQHKTWFSEFTAEEIKKQQPITDEFEKLYMLIMNTNINEYMFTDAAKKNSDDLAAWAVNAYSTGWEYKDNYFGNINDESHLRCADNIGLIISVITKSKGEK